MKIDEFLDNYLVDRLIHTEGMQKVVYREDLRRLVKDLLELASNNAKTMPEPYGGQFSEVVDKKSILNTLEE